MTHFEITIKHEESTSDGNKKQSQKEVLHQERDKFTRAYPLLFNVQIVMTTTLITVDSLVANNLSGLAVRMYRFAQAFARLAKLGRYLQVFQIGELGL